MNLGALCNLLASVAISVGGSSNSTIALYLDQNRFKPRLTLHKGNLL
jgi:hypothetical protein